MGRVFGSFGSGLSDCDTVLFDNDKVLSYLEPPNTRLQNCCIGEALAPSFRAK